MGDVRGEKLNDEFFCSSDLDEEAAVPSGASAGRDGADRPDGSHVEDGTARDCGVSGAVPAEDGENTSACFTLMCDTVQV